MIHLNGANDLAEHAENMKQIMIEWFPFIQSQLYTPAYREIRRIDLYYEDSDGVAWATPGAIHVSQQFARAIVNEPGGGMYIHEMTHVIHNPQSWGCPGWIVEGTAEYMRRWFYEPYTTPTKPTDPECNLTRQKICFVRFHLFEKIYLTFEFCMVYICFQWTIHILGIGFSIICTLS